MYFDHYWSREGAVLRAEEDLAEEDSKQDPDRRLKNPSPSLLQYPRLLGAHDP